MASCFFFLRWMIHIKYLIAEIDNARRFNRASLVYTINWISFFVSFRIPAKRIVIIIPLRNCYLYIRSFELFFTFFFFLALQCMNLRSNTMNEKFTHIHTAKNRTMSCLLWQLMRFSALAEYEWESRKNCYCYWRRYRIVYIVYTTLHMCMCLKAKIDIFQYIRCQ